MYVIWMHWEPAIFLDFLCSVGYDLVDSERPTRHRWPATPTEFPSALVKRCQKLCILMSFGSTASHLSLVLESVPNCSSPGLCDLYMICMQPKASATVRQSVHVLPCPTHTDIHSYYLINCI